MDPKPRPDYKYIIGKLIEYIFEAFFLTLALFFLAEFLKQGIVTNYFHFNWLLTLSIFFGIIIVVFLPREAIVPARQSVFRRITRHSLFLLAGAGSGWLAFQVMPDTLKIYAVLPWAIGGGIYCMLSLLWSRQE